MLLKLMKKQLLSADGRNILILTEAGRLMAWYYITFDTVKKFRKINGTETLSDLVN